MGNINAQITGLVIWWIVLTLISTTAACWVAYMVIKHAIRDGIEESGLVQALKGLKAPIQPSGQATGLPDMRADR